MVKQSQKIKQLLYQKLGRTISASTLALLLAFLSGLKLVEPGLAQTPASNPQSKLIKEIKALAHTDAENDIPRRTNFIIELYKNNSASLTSPTIRGIYDDAYTEQVKRKNEIRRNIWIGIITVLVFMGLLLVISAIKKKTFKIKTALVSLPFNLGQVELETDETARRAAWALYVELTTRIATQQLEADEGLMREALNSLYSLFSSTRQILREAGPNVGTSTDSVGGVAIEVLSKGLRPFLSEWHPALLAWEAQRTQNESPKEHEKRWDREPQLRSELKNLSKELEKYTNVLGKIVGINNK